MKLEIEVEFKDKRNIEDARRTETTIDSKLRELYENGLIKDYKITEKIRKV